MPDITWWIINRQLLPAWNCEAQSTSCVSEHILLTPHHFEALVVWCLNVSLNFEAWLVILSNITTGAATTYKYQLFGGRFKIKLKWFLKNLYIKQLSGHFDLSIVEMDFLPLCPLLYLLLFIAIIIIITLDIIGDLFQDSLESVWCELIFRYSPIIPCVDSEKRLC